jgi:tRNA pseudouridine synthase 10
VKNNIYTNEIIGKAKKISEKYKLCDRCLGRFFSKIDYGIENKIIGKNIRVKLKLKELNSRNCWLCIGLFDELNIFIELIIKKLKDFQYETFLIGNKVDEDIIENENQILKFQNLSYSESIKMELNREIGKYLEKKLRKNVNFENPDIMIIIDTSYNYVQLQIKPIYIYGKYNKYKRNLPQTKWHCKVCRGIGCRKCDYLGKIYQTSVEELIAKDILKVTNGERELFHGCGREDIDVRMLGDGRPFIIEIINPKIREINLTDIEKKINDNNKEIIKVNNLRFSNKEEIVRIKNSKFQKLYKFTFIGEKSINKEKLKKVALSLQGKTISQLTPTRVAFRRANIVRDRKIHSIKILSVDDNKATLMINATSGTYIKELISGDNGRTKPNISEMIGFPCQIDELDVIKIEGE